MSRDAEPDQPTSLATTDPHVGEGVWMDIAVTGEAVREVVEAIPALETAPIGGPLTGSDGHLPKMGVCRVIPADPLVRVHGVP